MKYRILIVVALAVVGLGVTVGGIAAKIVRSGKTDGPDTPATDAPPAVRVVAATPVRKTLRRTATEPGRLDAFEQTAIYVKLTAYVKEYFMDIGDLGRPDQPLATLWIPELAAETHQKEAQLQQARAAVEQAAAAIQAADAAVQTAQAGVQEAKAGMVRAQGKYERWKSEYARISQMAKDGTVDRQMADETLNELSAAEATRREVEAKISAAETLLVERKADLAKANADLAVSKAAVANAEADLERVRAMLEYTQIRMPYAGVVVQRNVNRGDLVLPANTGGKPLFVVAKIDVIRVFVDVPEMDAPWIKPGAAGTITIPSLREKKIEGTVTRTSEALDPNRTLLVELDVPNPERLLAPGMYVLVEITLEERPDVLALPLAAVLHEGGKTFCYCVERGQLAKRPIELGLSTATEVEVTSGLSGSETVVQVHAASFRAGERVEIAPTSVP